MAANAKWEAEAARNIEDAVNRSIQKMQLQAQVPKTRNLTPQKVQRINYFSGRNISAEMNAISSTISPTIDTSKVKAALAGMMELLQSQI